jgi:hypothetical protein
LMIGWVSSYRTKSYVSRGVLIQKFSQGIGF